jgi:hypothetical protein
MDGYSILFIVVFVVAWLVLVRFIFPRLGVPT